MTIFERIRRWTQAFLAPGFVFTLLALIAGTANAHHSVPVNFDQSREISVSGVLTEIKWLNPHSHFRMDVTGDDGNTVEWLVEMGSHNAMLRSGFQWQRFVVGDSVTITGWPGRRDRVVFLNWAVLGDGTEILCITSRCLPAEDLEEP